MLSVHELWKYLFKIHELWKNENVCSQCMNYDLFFFAIHELLIKKMFVCNTLIIKMFVCILKLWKHENICLQYMNYENF